MAKESTRRTTIPHTADNGPSCFVCTYTEKMRAKMKEWRKRPRDHICRGALEEQKRSVGLFHHSLILRVNFCSPLAAQTRRRSAWAWSELKSTSQINTLIMCGSVVDPKCMPTHRWRDRSLLPRESYAWHCE